MTSYLQIWQVPPCTGTHKGMNTLSLDVGRGGGASGMENIPLKKWHLNWQLKGEYELAKWGGKEGVSPGKKRNPLCPQEQRWVHVVVEERVRWGCRWSQKPAQTGSSRPCGLPLYFLKDGDPQMGFSHWVVFKKTTQAVRGEWICRGANNGHGIPANWLLQRYKWEEGD